MKRNLILLAVVLSTVYGILYTSSAAAAEVGFSVSESLFDISLPPGAEQEVQLVVFNQSNAEPLPVHLELTLWGLNDDTDSIEFTTADEALNAARWFELAGTPDFILQPTGEHEVVWNISVPPEAPAGSYLVMARFIPALPEHYFSEAGPRSVPELGVLFFIKVVPLGFEMADSYRASITSFQPQGRGWKFIPGAEAAAKAGQAGVYGSLASAFQALVKNEGLYFFKAQGTV
ncbi:MAG: hypothetical protein U1C53_01230, partial [Candidatus Veblenbacteria bacterium]|nr:hypothetical protein [Candidatus Veblenbacteria bacterium]